MPLSLWRFGKQNRQHTTSPIEKSNLNRHFHNFYVLLDTAKGSERVYSNALPFFPTMSLAVTGKDQPLTAIGDDFQAQVEAQGIGEPNAEGEGKDEDEGAQELESASDDDAQEDKDNNGFDEYDDWSDDEENKEYDVVDE